MENKSVHIFEAERIGNYLLGINVQDSEKNTYADAMQKLNIQFSKYEQALWEKMIKSKSKMVIS